MRPTERDHVIAALEANLRNVERAVSRLDEAGAVTRPSPDGWSPLEILEHLTVVERGAHKAIAAAAGQGPSDRRTRDLDALVAGAATYPEPIRSPEMALPTGRYATIAQALQIFRERRTATLDLARTLDVDWDAHHFAHPRFGPLDVGQWFLLAATHGDRHVLQIERQRP